MRLRLVAAVAGGLALAQAGCGGQATGAAGYTCGHMRDTTGAFRQQASVIVDGKRLRAHRLSREESVLGAELHVRRACDGAGAGDRPYRRAAGVDSPGWVAGGTAR
jgi:hypothetical protein